MKNILLIILFIMLSFVGYCKNIPTYEEIALKNYREFENRKINIFKQIRFGKIDSNAIYIAHHFANIHSDTANIDTLVKMLIKPCKNDAEKYRAIYMWMCLHVKYDFDLMGKIISKTKTDYNIVENDNWNWCNIFINNKAVCCGRSILFDELCHRANLFSCTISGIVYDSMTGPIEHAWNTIRIDNNYYMLDCTYHISSLTFGIDYFILNSFDKYYLERMCFNKILNSNQKIDFDIMKQNIYKNAYHGGTYRSESLISTESYDFKKVFFNNIKESKYWDYVHNTDKKYIKVDYKSFNKKRT